MSKNKSILHELPDEELIKLATGSSETVDMGKLTEVVKFIYGLKIRAGKAKVPAALIYYSYKLWKGFENKRQPKASFFREFSQRFEPHRDEHERYYLLDPRSFNMSEEFKWEYQADLRRQRRRGNKNEKAQ